MPHLLWAGFYPLGGCGFLGTVCCHPGKSLLLPLYRPPEDFSGLGVSVGDVVEKRGLLLSSGVPRLH